MTEQKALTRVQSACNSLAKMEQSLADLLPKSIPSDKFIQTAKMAVQNPMIAEKINDGTLNMPSLYASCQKAAADGLVLDGREAALGLYWNKTEKRNEAQYMPMVYGIIKRVKNSGDVASISAHVVYKNDKFKHVKAPVEEVHHESVALDEDPGEKIGVYAVAVLNSGERVYSVMTKTQVLAVKGAAKTKYVWDGAFGDQMWEKSAIRRLAKRLPSAAEGLNALFKSDDETYEFNHARDITDDAEEIEPENTGTRAESIVMSQAQADNDLQGDEPPPADENGDAIAEAEFEEIDDSQAAPAPAAEKPKDDGLPI